MSPVGYLPMIRQAMKRPTRTSPSRNPIKIRNHVESQRRLRPGFLAWAASGAPESRVGCPAAGCDVRGGPESSASLESKSSSKFPPDKGPRIASTGGKSGRLSAVGDGCVTGAACCPVGAPGFVGMPLIDEPGFFNG